MVKENEDIEVSEMDLIYESHDRIDALIELLVDKGVITQPEFEKKLDKIYEENYE